MEKLLELQNGWKAETGFKVFVSDFENNVKIHGSIIGGRCEKHSVIGLIPKGFIPAKPQLFTVLGYDNKEKAHKIQLKVRTDGELVFAETKNNLDTIQFGGVYYGK